jgi:DNA-binding response OmpR family regulator|tara:strand:- start:1646 stop:2044 length:399 start_codon:yes stop_codon:yes gene_type:complete
MAPKAIRKGRDMAKHVLIIEDEPNIVEALSFILSRDGWAVSLHADGNQAVEAVQSKRPNLVILDVMLPNKSGFDILKDLRDSVDTREVPVLMLTARGQNKDRMLAEKLGVSRFMTKPFSNADILSAVQDLTR